jgi:hypothetical protein
MSGNNTFHFEENGKFFKRSKDQKGNNTVCEVAQCRCGDWISLKTINTPHHLGRKNHRAWASQNGEALVEPYCRSASSKLEDDTESDSEDSSENHWLLRIGDGVHFANSSKKNIWGVEECKSKKFLKNVKKGDKLWFVLTKSQGLLVSVATFDRVQKRELGPFIAVTATNHELGWTEQDGEWDTEVLFENQYDIRALNLLSRIQGQNSIHSYNESCKVNLPAEYDNIVHYSQVFRC